ncbi:hypothetical protein N566_26030 [Streptomycetaceae bacterium MP113-05]|nr:hypothetical protein N566_26030 [Streptomycetaceae bacterium MP113-05]
MTPDGQTQQSRVSGAPSALRRVVFRGSLFAACYGLTLCVLLENWFLLAIPGLIGMVTIGGLVAVAITTHRASVEVPFATDGSDSRGPLAHHRSAVLKSYPLVLALVAVLVGLVVLVKSDYLIPLAPMAAAGFIMGTRSWLGQLLTLNQCARVLKVYRFTHRTPVKVLHRARGGKQLFRLGSGEHESPRLIGSQVGGEKDWGKRVGDEVWFAGDELFGGVLLVPGSGELVAVQPSDLPAVGPQRAAAAPDRQELAKKAGIGRSR